MRWMARALAIALLALPSAVVSTTATGGTKASSHINAYVGIFEGQTRHNLIRFESTVITATFSSSAGTDFVPIELWADTYNTAPHRIATLTTDNLGKVSRTVTPKNTTKYQFRFVEDATRLGSESVLLTVGVHTKVTLGLNDSSLRIGQTMVARGTTYPHKPGVTATLWRVTFPSWTKLATGKVRSDGTYRITKTFRSAAPRSLVVTVPAAAGNLKGTSPARTANVG
jgi:hypothetical protein